MKKVDSGYVSARFYAQREYRSGKGSRYISPLNVKRGDRVYLVCRKSGCERPAQLKRQIANLKRLMERLGAVIVGVFVYEGSGFDPIWVGAAARRAKRAGAKYLIAECVNRFVRNRHYHSVRNPDLQATELELKQLSLCAQGMPLMTYLHPDATPAEERKFQTKRGQRETRNQGGRPRTKRPGYKKQMKRDKLGLVLWLHKQGWSVRRIAQKPMVTVPKSTVARWIEQHS